MPRTCTICRHPKLNAIDKMLIGHQPLRAVATQHRVSKTSLIRHRDFCLPSHLVKAKEDSDTQTASALVKELRELTQKTDDVLAQALRERNYELALKAIARLERQLELKGRLLGELEESGRSETVVRVVYVDKQITLHAPGAPLLLPPAPERSE